MADPLEIKLHLDVADAMAKQQAVGAKFKQTADAADASTKKVGDAITRNAKGQFVAVNKVGDASAKVYGQMASDAKKSGQAQEDAIKKVGSAVIGAVQGAATATAVFSAGMKVFDYFANKFEAMRNSIIGSVKELEEMRRQVLGLAALNDRLGNTTPEVKASLEFRAKTLQGREQATQFQEGIKNTGQASIGRKISQEQFDALAVKGGQFQAAVGGPAETHGEFLGALPSLMKTAPGQMLQADAVFAQQQKIFDILQKGGSSLEVGAQQLLKNSSLSATGIYGKDGAQQAALQSAFSLKQPDSPGVMVDQFTRATVGALGKMRGSGVAGDEKQAEYLKKLGATDQMDPIAIGRLISDDLKKQEASQVAKGQVLNPYAYLGHHGYSDDETKKALMNFHAINQSGELGVFEGMAGAAPSAAKADAAINNFQKTDPAAAAMRNKVAEDLAHASQASGADEYYQQIKQLAYSRLLAQKKVYGEPGAAGLKEWEKGHSGWFDGSRSMIVDEAAKISDEQAKAVGVPTYRDIGRPGDTSGGRILQFSAAESEETRAKKFYDQATKIGAAGGNPNAGIDVLVDLARRQLAATERAEELMRKGQREPAPALAPGGKNAGRDR